MGRYAAWSFSWLNEGHIPDHHRDGPLLQAWARLPLLDNRLELAAGAGPYWFFDTVAAEAGESYSNTHGWGARRERARRLLLCQSLGRPAEAESRREPTAVRERPASCSASATSSTRRTNPGRASPRRRAAATSPDDELTLMYGRSILNSQVSETSTAGALEYRRGLARVVDVTATYLHEAGDLHSRRDGIAAQLWLTGGYFGDRLTLVRRRGTLCRHHPERRSDR